MATVVVSADAFVRSHGARRGQGALRLRKPKFPGGGVHLVLLAGVSLLALHAFNKWESEQDYLYDEELKELKPSSASEGSLYTNPTGAAAGTLIPPSFPGPDSTVNGCPAVAELLLQHWRNQTQLAVHGAVRATEYTSEDTLKSLNLLSPNDYCYLKMRYEPAASRVQLADLNVFFEICKPISKDKLLLRAYMVQFVFNELIAAKRQTAKPAAPFEFWIDLSDGTRNNVELFSRLHLPILTFARHPNDRHTIPVPDLDMLTGLYSGFDFGAMHWGSPELQRRAQYLANIYVDHAWASDWSTKIPKVVFRGSCVPTISSDNMYPPSREPFRAMLCSRYSDNPAFDIGMEVDEPPCNDTSTAPAEAWCDQCSKCAGRKEMSPREQSVYKYQVIMEGQGGASSEDAAWKLLSNSAVIRLRSDMRDTTIFEQFFEPLVQPFMIPSNIAGLPATMQWCDSHGDACQRAASGAQSIMTCMMRKEVIDDYMWGVFTYMHDSVI